MQVYLPNSYAHWLQTTPSEGQVLMVAFLAKLHAIYGVDTYFEMYNEDLDCINHTALRGTTMQEVKKLKTAGLINQANGISMRTTIRLAENLLTGLNRYTLFDNGIPYDLSLNGAIIWVYLLGRMAAVDNEVEIIPVAKVREYGNTKNAANWRGVEKSCVTHILPSVYKDQFQKEVGQSFTGIKDVKPLIDKPERGSEDYHKWYYQMRKQDVLERKRTYYREKKDKE